MSLICESAGTDLNKNRDGDLSQTQSTDSFASLAVVLAQLLVLIMAFALAILSSQTLEDSDYSRFYSFMSLLVMLSSSTLAIQAVVARNSHIDMKLTWKSQDALAVAMYSYRYIFLIHLVITITATILFSMPYVLSGIALLSAAVTNFSGAVTGFRQANVVNLRFPVYLVLTYATGYAISLIAVHKTSSYVLGAAGYLIGAAFGCTLLLLDSYRNDLIPRIKKTLTISISQKKIVSVEIARASLGLMFLNLFFNAQVLFSGKYLVEPDARTYILSSQFSKFALGPTYILILLIFVSLIDSKSISRILTQLYAGLFVGGLSCFALYKLFDSTNFANSLLTTLGINIGLVIAFLNLGFLYAAIQFLVYLSMAQNRRATLYLLATSCIMLFAGMLASERTTFGLLSANYKVSTALLILASLVVYKGKRNSQNVILFSEV